MRLLFKTTCAALFTVCLWPCLLPGEARAETSPPSDQHKRHLQSTLRHLLPRLKSASEKIVFATGKSGTFEIEFTLADPRYRFNHAAGPASLRIVAPEGSNIILFSRTGSSMSAGQEALLTISPGKDGVLAAKVEYSVSPQARVKDRALQLDLAAALLTPSGRSILDSGRVSVPIRVETPQRTKTLVVIIIALVIFLFVVEWVRVDVVAVMMMVSMPILGLLHSKDTFTGLSSNAVVAIIGVMIVSAGLNKVGIVSKIVAPVIRLAGKSESRLMIYICGLIAAISSVMQNTGAAVLFLPGIRHACKTIQTPISRVLMPIGMCAILGGTMTMIGTSPLILLNDILPSGMDKFALLELTPIGMALVLGGIIYFSTGGRAFLSRVAKEQAARKGIAALVEEQEKGSWYHEIDGPFELQIPKDYRASSRDTINEIRQQYLVQIVGLADEKNLQEIAPPMNRRIRPGFSICVYGATEQVEHFAKDRGFVLLDKPQVFKELFNPAVAGTTEAVVSPRSALIGKTILEIQFRKTFGVTALALYREGKTYYKEKSDIPLMAGDAIFLHGTWEHFELLSKAHRNFVFTSPLDVEIQTPKRAKVAGVCFLITLTLMLVSSFYYQKKPYNPIPLSVCLMTGAIAMVVTRVLSMREAYQAVDWRTVFLLGGLIPLGMAVDRTGTAEWIATGIVSALGSSVSPLILLIVLATLSGAFTLVISNVGACTLLVPLGVAMATQIGINPRLAAIVVGMGVSNSFLLPTHQVNALYMGPGDYRVKDYMKIGSPMSLLYVIILVLMAYFFYA